MKRTGIWLALALGLASHGVMAKTLNVVSSFSVLGDMAQQIGGEHVHVDTLVGPDGDPHTFEPSPKDSALLSKADVVVVNGLGLEGWRKNPYAGRRWRNGNRSARVEQRRERCAVCAEYPQRPGESRPGG